MAALFHLNEWGPIEAETFKWPVVVLFASYLYYIVVLLNVGRSRYKYRIFPPKTTGNPDFERIFRVQMNYVEQFPGFALSLIFCAIFVNGEVAGILGFIWLLFRVLYSYRYASRHLKKDVYLYTAPQYLAIFLMYLFPVLRCFGQL